MRQFWRTNSPAYSFRDLSRPGLQAVAENNTNYEIGSYCTHTQRQKIKSKNKKKNRDREKWSKNYISPHIFNHQSRFECGPASFQISDISHKSTVDRLMCRGNLYKEHKEKINLNCGLREQKGRGIFSTSSRQTVLYHLSFEFYL